MLPDEDTTGHFLRCAMGMFLESLRIVFANAGFALVYIALRQLCSKDAALCQTLFGRENPPMIFQYNPLDYVIDQSPEGELVFTIARLVNVAPKIRYNLHDRGGAWRFGDLKRCLAEMSIDADRLASEVSRFPLLYVYGRSDLSVPFFRCKVFPTDLDQIIHQDSRLAQHLNSFSDRERGRRAVQSSPSSASGTGGGQH